MVGVGRSYISRVIQTLKMEKALKTARGALLVEDVATLRRRSRACNDAVRSPFEIVLKGVYPNAGDILTNALAEKRTIHMVWADKPYQPGC